jgi:parallel beta-helix repeat protein
MVRLGARLFGFGRIAIICFLIALLVSGYLRISTECYSHVGRNIAASALLNSSTVNVHFIDVGWGDAIFIDTLGMDVLVDGGLVEAGPTVLEYLENLGIAHVDLMVVSHPHIDHYGGLMTILNSSIEVNQVLFNNESHPADFLRLARSHNLTAASRGQTFALAEDVVLTVLNPVQPLEFPSADWSRHYNNIVLKLQVGNTSFLFTGDANALAEQSMIDTGLDLRSNVLKVGIHGCGEMTWENVTSQGFLDRVNPSYAVISCDYSNGGGSVVPDPLVARRLITSNISTYTTYLMGTIVAFTDGTSITFSDNAHYQYAVELKGHTKAVYSVAWSPDETLLASGSKDGTVRLWDTATWTTARTINAHSLGVWSVAWSPNGTMLATGGMENALRLWNPQTGEQLATFNTSSSIFSVSWSPDGSRLAAGLSNGNVCVFNVETGETVHALTGHTNIVVSTAWAPEGSRLASGSIDRSIRIWDAQNGSVLFTLYANTTARNDINGLAWSPDGTILVAAGQDGNTRLWNPNLGLEMQVASHDEQGWSRGVSWSPNGLFLATTGQDYFVRFLCPKIRGNAMALPGHLSPVWSVAWSPSGKLFATGSGMYETVGGDTRVLVWNVSAIQDRIVVVPDDFATIQEAINNAADGDTVFVKAGTYYEHVVVNKMISLTGENCATTIVDGNWTGVTIDVTRNGVIVSGFTVERSGSFYWENAGILLGNIENCSISENILTENSFAGLELNYSRGCSVSGNTIVRNGGVGITLVGGSLNDLSRNNFLENGWSALTLIDNANNNTVSENSMTSNNLAVTGHCINLYRSSNNLIHDNIIMGDDNGIRLEYWSNFNAISQNNITDNTQTGVSVENNADNNTISGNMISGSRFGIAVNGSIYAEICSNMIAHNYGSGWDAGIRLDSAGYTLIHENEITDNWKGILLTASSPYVSICGNDVTSNEFGIRVSGGGTSYLNVSGNFVANNRGYGIGLTGIGGASSFAVISGNTIVNNSEGIAFGQDSNDNTVYRNNISLNRCGFHIELSTRNLIFSNNMVDNDQQAYVASGSINVWDRGYPNGGNYWSDYNGTDENWDGIGDTPYLIDRNNIDHYPLTQPFPSPQPFPWDLTGDGYVGIDDILAAAQSFGATPESSRWNPKADINNDSYAGIDDILEIAMHFGKSAPTIPESTTCAAPPPLAAPALIMFFRKRTG